jgi:hypothetical protein
MSLSKKIIFIKRINKVVKSSGVYDPICGFGRLSYETLINLTYHYLNIFKKYHLEFF